MIIEVSPGAMFEVPANGDFRLRFKSSFTLNEVQSATKSVDVTGPDHVTASMPASYDGQDLILDVTPGLFGEGLWELNPVLVIAGKRRTWPLAAGMNVLLAGVSRVPGQGSAVNPFQ